MKKARRPWPIAIALIGLALLIGLAASFDIVRRDGWRGLWNRKKDFLKTAKPESAPLLDEAERRISSQERLK